MRKFKEFSAVRAHTQNGKRRPCTIVKHILAGEKSSSSAAATHTHTHTIEPVCTIKMATNEKASSESYGASRGIVHGTRMHSRQSNAKPLIALPRILCVPSLFAVVYVHGCRCRCLCVSARRCYYCSNGSHCVDIVLLIAAQTFFI